MAICFASLSRGESYSPDGPDRKNLQISHNPTVKLGEFRRSGTLAEWGQAICRDTMFSFYPCSPRHCCEFCRSEFASDPVPIALALTLVA